MHAFFKTHRDAWKPSQEFVRKLIRALPAPHRAPTVSPVTWRWIVALPAGVIAILLIVISTANRGTAPQPLEQKTMPIDTQSPAAAPLRMESSSATSSTTTPEEIP